MTGDELLARAVGMRAVDQALNPIELGNGWGTVVDRWAEGQPQGTLELIDELADIDRNRTNVQRRFASTMEYVLPTPRELLGKDITALAAQADKNPDESEAPPDPDWIRRRSGAIRGEVG